MGLYYNVFNSWALKLYDFGSLTLRGLGFRPVKETLLEIPPHLPAA